MAGNIIVRYAKKTHKQRRAEAIDSKKFETLNHSVDILPETISIMTFDDWNEASRFAKHVREEGNHVLEIKDDYTGRTKK